MFATSGKEKHEKLDYHIVHNIQIAPIF